MKINFFQLLRGGALVGQVSTLIIIIFYTLPNTFTDGWMNNVKSLGLGVLTGLIALSIMLNLFSSKLIVEKNVKPQQEVAAPTLDEEAEEPRKPQSAKYNDSTSIKKQLEIIALTKLLEDDKLDITLNEPVKVTVTNIDQRDGNITIHKEVTDVSDVKLTLKMKDVKDMKIAQVEVKKSVKPEPLKKENEDSMSFTPLENR